MTEPLWTRSKLKFFDSSSRFLCRVKNNYLWEKSIEKSLKKTFMTKFSWVRNYCNCKVCTVLMSGDMLSVQITNSCFNIPMTSRMAETSRIPHYSFLLLPMVLCTSRIEYRSLSSTSSSYCCVQLLPMLVLRPLSKYHHTNVRLSSPSPTLTLIMVQFVTYPLLHAQRHTSQLNSWRGVAKPAKPS